MLYKNEESFSKAFKSSDAQGLYLLYGNESYLVDAWAKRIVGKACGDASAFNFQKLDGRKLDCDLLCDATEAMPLMASGKCVLLDDLDASKTPAEQQKKLEEIFSDLNPACVLVVTAKPPLFDSKSAAGKKIIKLAEQHGTAVELNSRGAVGLTAFLKSAAKKNGCEISPDVCRYILRICENDMHTLTAEIGKICAFANGAEIKQEHVDAVAVPKVEARVFDLAKAILSGNLQKAMEILANLFYLRESPVAILSALSMSYVDIYRARIARNEGVNAPELSKMFGYKSEFRVQNAFNSRLSAEQLRTCIKYLYDCDVKMKSTGIDDKILLETAVTKLFMAGR